MLIVVGKDEVASVSDVVVALAESSLSVDVCWTSVSCGTSVASEVASEVSVELVDVGTLVSVVVATSISIELSVKVVLTSELEEEDMPPREAEAVAEVLAESEEAIGLNAAASEGSSTSWTAGATGVKTSVTF